MAPVKQFLYKSVAELRKVLLERKVVASALIEALASDPREGARRLSRILRSRRERDHRERLRLRRLFRFERELWAQDYLLVDARTVPGCPAPQRGIIHGDALSASIAAASIVAKTTRDALMEEYDRIYPGYRLAAHKGYPTPEHCRLLKELGPLPIHRRSFARVRQVLGLDPVQDELFAEELETEEQIEPSRRRSRLNLEPSLQNRER